MSLPISTEALAVLDCSAVLVAAVWGALSISWFFDTTLYKKYRVVENVVLPTLTGIACIYTVVLGFVFACSWFVEQPPPYAEIRCLLHLAFFCGVGIFGSVCLLVLSVNACLEKLANYRTRIIRKRNKFQ